MAERDAVRAADVRPAGEAEEVTSAEIIGALRQATSADQAAALVAAWYAARARAADRVPSRMNQDDVAQRRAERRLRAA